MPVGLFIVYLFSPKRERVISRAAALSRRKVFRAGLFSRLFAVPFQ